MSQHPKPPSPGQLKFAQDLAKRRNEKLPPEIAQSQEACSAYIDKHKTVKPDANKNPLPDKDKALPETEPASKPQIEYAQRIGNLLQDVLGADELALALNSKVECSRFIQRYEKEFFARREIEKRKQEQEVHKEFRQKFNSLELVSADLRKALAAASSLVDACKIIREHARELRSAPRHIDPKSLETMHERLLGYWLEGLQSTAFDALGKLDNLAGDRKHFGADDIVPILTEAPCNDLNKAQNPPPLRHLVLKLEHERDKNKKPLVISVLPLTAIPAQDDPRGYRWGAMKETAPQFNRRLLGEQTDWDGLMLDRVEAFDHWVESFESPVEDNADAGVDLAHCLALWDQAFDILRTTGSGGLHGWIRDFLANRPGFPRLKWYKPVFVLVDGGAAKGASLHVCNAYRQVLLEPTLLTSTSLSLFQRVVDLASPSARIYDPASEGRKSTHVSRYFGHMDALKDGVRKAFPLDPAQRDALIALTATKHGESLAVNGPPGTGKTSLLRAVIASMWIEPLLTEKKYPECPMIIACAATNQAVTNVISSFDETPGPELFDQEGQLSCGETVGLDSRWLPHLVSYGWYAPPNITKDVLKKYSAYQLLHRKNVQDAWQFEGASSSLDAINDTQVEDAFLACAARHYGVDLDLDKVLERLRGEVRSGSNSIRTIQSGLEQWLETLDSLMATPSWTSSLEKQRQQWLAQGVQLTDPGGRRSQLEQDVANADALLSALASFNDFGAPIQKYEKLLKMTAGNQPAGNDTDYQSIRQQCEDIAKLAREMEAHRHTGFKQRLQSAFAKVFRRQEIKQRWETLGEALRDCGVVIPDRAPEHVEWINAVEERRRQLRDRLDAAAKEGLRLHLRTFGVIIESASDDVSLWPAEVEKHRQMIRVKRSAASVERQSIDEKITIIKAQVDALDKIRKRHEKAVADAVTVRNALARAFQMLGGKPATQLFEQVDQALTKASESRNAELDSVVHRRDVIQHTQDWLDINVRPSLFHRAARYWEGRFVQSRKSLAKRAKEDDIFQPTSEERLRQLAMLAPVFVVTAYSVPKLMRRAVLEPADDAPPYLFGTADLLIVDEAGQGTPEIGGCPFLFARKAIVVGDTEQLRPVWSMEQATDRGLVHRFDLIPHECAEDETPYQALKRKGVLLASGSVMYMAQRTSAWTDPRFPNMPGLMLTNHYRCLSPIIEICNRMVYGGALRVATQPPPHLWRPELGRLGYLVIDDVPDTKLPTGSRRNDKEAACIARWIRENEAALLQHYGQKEAKTLPDLVAIVTPFKGQVQALKQAIAKQFGAKFEDKNALHNKMVIDTVHSLQGAEKPIVIFAMVDTTAPASSQFYDDGTNLINVAISRAKEMFIVTMTQAAVTYARSINPESPGKPSNFLWQAAVANGTRLNPRHLIVVESPNKCDTIRQALGDSVEIEVLATSGHIAQLAEPDSWDAMQANEPQWGQLSDAASKVFARLEMLWSDLETIYLATDPDPEGEAIAWHVMRIIRERVGDAYETRNKQPQIKRMRFFNLRPNEIRNAYAQASDGLDAGLVKSALTRALLDHIIAANYPARLGLGASNTFQRGIGRVQLGVLDLVRNGCTVPDQYRIKVSIPLREGAVLDTSLAIKTLDEPSAGTRVWTTDSLHKAERTLSHICKEYLSVVQHKTIDIRWSRGPLRQAPPYPALNTARFLALAWRATRMKPVRVMEALQALYEGVTEIKNLEQDPRGAGQLQALETSYE